MIVDTSALVAVAQGEDGWDMLRIALLDYPCMIPAPAITELALVVGLRDGPLRTAAFGLLDELLAHNARVVPFTERHAEISRAARERYGRANGRGGLLNFGDLMVYAIAKDRGEPLLCTGRDFASTDLAIHPASRLG